MGLLLLKYFPHTPSIQEKYTHPTMLALESIPKSIFGYDTFNAGNDTIALQELI